MRRYHIRSLFSLCWRRCITNCFFLVFWDGVYNFPFPHKIITWHNYIHMYISDLGNHHGFHQPLRQWRTMVMVNGLRLLQQVDDGVIIHVFEPGIPRTITTVSTIIRGGTMIHYYLQGVIDRVRKRIRPCCQSLKPEAKSHHHRRRLLLHENIPIPLWFTTRTCSDTTTGSNRWRPIIPPRMGWRGYIPSCGLYQFIHQLMFYGIT